MERAKEVERQVAACAKRLKATLAKLLPQGPNEATLRHHVEPILREFCAEVGVDPEVRDEYVVAKGKIADAVFDRLVVEFKRPGVLSSPRTRQEAIEQLKGYLEGLAKKERRKRLAGVVIDGEQVLFMRFRTGHISLEPPSPAERATLEKFLRWLAASHPGPHSPPRTWPATFPSTNPVPRLPSTHCTGPSPSTSSPSQRAW